MREAIINIITLRTSGEYGWWDDFPLAISNKSKELGIDYYFCYRGFSERSRIPEDRRIVFSHRQAGNPVEVWKKFSPILKRYDRVIFHTHSGHGNNGFFVFSNKLNKKTYWITTDHDSWFTEDFSGWKRNVRVFLRSLGLFPDVMVGCSLASKRRLSQIYGQRNVTYIYNGTTFPSNRVTIDEDKIRRGIFVGRVEGYKGVFTMVEAVEILKKKGIDFHLDVVGSGGAIEDLQRMVREKGLDDRVALHGHKYNVWDYIKNCGIGFLLSEWNENFPISSLEIQSMGLVSIYANSGGMPESHINGKTGIMVPKRDARAVADAVEFLISNVDKAKEMSVCAVENVKRFSLDNMAGNYLRLYKCVFDNWGDTDKAMSCFEGEARR